MGELGSRRRNLNAMGANVHVGQGPRFGGDRLVVANPYPSYWWVFGSSVQHAKR